MSLARSTEPPLKVAPSWTRTPPPASGTTTEYDRPPVSPPTAAWPPVSYVMTSPVFRLCVTAKTIALPLAPFVRSTAPASNDPSKTPPTTSLCLAEISNVPPA